MVGKYARNSKYFVGEMESTDYDYKLIKKSVKDSVFGHYKVDIHKIYRVIERGSDETSQQKSDNLLLFHGTTRKNAVGILEKGFKASTGGLYGPGVYLTASSNVALSYSVMRTNRRKIKSNVGQTSSAEKLNTLLGVFVNEILESEMLNLVDSENQRHKSQFARYIVKGTAKKSSDENYEEDSNGRRIRTSRGNKGDHSNHYVCRKRFVIPRCYIEFCSR